MAHANVVYQSPIQCQSYCTRGHPHDTPSDENSYILQWYLRTSKLACACVCTCFFFVGNNKPTRKVALIEKHAIPTRVAHTLNYQCGWIRRNNYSHIHSYTHIHVHTHTHTRTYTHIRLSLILCVCNRWSSTPDGSNFRVCVCVCSHFRHKWREWVKTIIQPNWKVKCEINEHIHTHGWCLCSFFTSNQSLCLRDLNESFRTFALAPTTTTNK